MGWTFTNKGTQSIQEFFAEQFNYEKPDEKKSGKVLRCSATWNVAYMAYEVIAGEKREVVAVVCLLMHVPKAKDGYTFGYKDMTESMGPNEARCPKTILEMLTPTESQYASDWRDRCWARIHKKAAQPKVKAGDVIKFNQTFTFRNGYEGNTFKFESGSTFKDGYNRFRIANWREKEYTVMGREYFYEFKGTMPRKDQSSCTIVMSGRFVSAKPTEQEARKAAFEAYPTLDSIEYITFKPVE